MSSAARTVTLTYLTLFMALRAVAFVMSAGAKYTGAAVTAENNEKTAPAATSFRQRGRLVEGRASAGMGTLAGGLDTSASLGGSPSHLVVLAHGLAGTPEDLTFLKKCLDERGGRDVLVHLARCNKGKTKDGVAEGGLRLADEVLNLVEATPSLRRISFVGNSLGGLYVRYAAKLLYRDHDDGNGSAGAVSRKSPAGMVSSIEAAATPTPSASRDGEMPAGDEGKDETLTSKSPMTSKKEGEGGAKTGGTVAGLQPSVFMTIATPHLGVRRFTYVQLPSVLHPLAGVFVGKTGSDLFLSDHPQRRRGSGSHGRSRSRSRSGSSSDDSVREGGSAVENAAPLVGTSAAEGVALPSRDTGGDVRVGRSGSGSSNISNGSNGNGSGSSGVQSEHGRGTSLLYEMATSEEYLIPLRAFRWRRAYANRRGDFMVPYGTAAFLGKGERDGVLEVSTSAGAERNAGVEGDGINGTLTVADRLWGAKHGAIVGISRVPRMETSGGKRGSRSEYFPTTQDRSRLSAGTDREGSTALNGRRSSNRRGSRRSLEEDMAAGLNSCGWEKVSVDFGGVMPLSHNKICALSRTPLLTYMYKSGNKIVNHAADYLITHDGKEGGETDEAQ